MGQYFNRFIPPANGSSTALPESSFFSLLKDHGIEATLSSEFSQLRHLYTRGDFEYYIANDRATGAAIEIKVLTEEAASDSERREMFYLESRAASSLSHINILESSAVRDLNHLLFCVREYKATARTLRERLRREGWLDLRHAIDIADEIASALDYAHRQGVLHLNLHPENILIESNGLVYIKGFGIEQSAGYEWARRYRSRRQPAPYLSLEQIAGADADFRSDLYSLGLIVFEMLTDRVPFDPEDVIYATDERARHLIPPPHFFRNDIPASVSDVVLRILAKKPADRFDSASEFVSALRDTAQTVECQHRRDDVRSITYVP